MTLYLGPTAEQLATIPAVLKARRHWVLWRAYPRANHPDKLDKRPINPYDLTNASTTDALTWGAFDDATAALATALEEWEHDTRTPYLGGGIGYVTTQDDPYVGVDLDDCVDDVTGEVAPWAQVYLDRLASYSEITPSSEGLRIWVEAELPPGHNRKGQVEMYSTGRFFTVTGWHVLDTPATIEPRQQPLQDLWAALFGADGGARPVAASDTLPSPVLPDYAVLSHAFHAVNREKFTALYTGAWQPLGYPSQSEADCALCGLLRFWTQDPAQIDRLFRQSGLMRPKWDERRGAHSYGARTVAAALAEPGEHYTPPPTLVVGQRTAWTPNGTEPLQGQAWGIPGPSAGGSPLIITDLADMLTRTYPLPTWLIDHLIPEGLIFFIGSPKSSKTYLGYSLALSLATVTVEGGLWFAHYPVKAHGPVVYITLEDDEADSRYRVAELAPSLRTIARERLLFVHGETFPRFDQGLVQVLEQHILQRYHPSLVVLDPISYLYSPLKRAGDQFSEVRDMLLPLRWLGRQYHCTIAGVDHRRKQTANDIDIFETQYGSVGKSAIADGLFMIVRDDKEITVHARIRKARDQTLTLTFEFHPDGSATWLLKGAVDGLVGVGQYGDLRSQVLNALSGSTIPLSIQDILAGLNMPDSRQTRNTVYQILFRAQKSREVQKTNRGQYVWSGGN